MPAVEYMVERHLVNRQFRIAETEIEKILIGSLVLVSKPKDIAVEVFRCDRVRYSKFGYKRVFY